MKTIFASLLFVVAFYSCAQTQNNPVKIPTGVKQKIAGNESVATFGQGCFWHSEIVFQSLVGVRDAVSGYAGGKDNNPDYDKVCSGKTGHAECVH